MGVDDVHGKPTHGGAHLRRDRRAHDDHSRLHPGDPKPQKIRLRGAMFPRAWEPGPRNDSSPMIVPASIDALMPTLTSSPMITPSFGSPVSTSDPLHTTRIGASSSRRLATFVPAPRLQRSPRMLSPT